MAEHNKQKAMPNTLSVLYVFSLFSVMIAISLEECIVNLKLILPFLVGGMSLLRFGFFLFYEKSVTNNMPQLKTKIHELRKEHNMKQEELAKLVGVRRETIGHLENEKYNPSLKLAMDIAKVFGKSVEEVFQFVD